MRKGLTNHSSYGGLLLNGWHFPVHPEPFLHISDFLVVLCFHLCGYGGAQRLCWNLSPPRQSCGLCSEKAICVSCRVPLHGRPGAGFMHYSRCWLWVGVATCFKSGLGKGTDRRGRSYFLKLGPDSSSLVVCSLSKILSPAGWGLNSPHLFSSLVFPIPGRQFSC